MIFDELKVQRFHNFVVDEVSRILRDMSRATTHADYDQANRRYSSSFSLLNLRKNSVVDCAKLCFMKI